MASCDHYQEQGVKYPPATAQSTGGTSMPSLVPRLLRIVAPSGRGLEVRRDFCPVSCRRYKHTQLDQGLCYPCIPMELSQT